MFSEKMLENFVRDFGADVSVESSLEDGIVQWTGTVAVDGKIVAQAKVPDLPSMPCELAVDFRRKLKDAKAEKVEDLPACQAAALDKGIPGIARPKAFDGDPAGASSLKDSIPE